MDVSLVAWVGFLGTWFGLGVALYQLKKTKNAATAAQQAASSARERILSLRAPLSVRVLRQQELAIDAAISTDNHQMARLALMQWRHESAEVLSLLGAQGIAPEEIARQVSSLNTRIAEAEESLSDTDQRVATAVGGVWLQISDTTHRLAVLANSALGEDYTQ